MKKFFNSIIIVASFLLLVVLALAAVNDVVHFIDVSKFQNVIDFLREYGAIICVGALVFVNVLAKSVIRIIFTLLFLAAFVVYVLATSFPGVFGV